MTLCVFRRFAAFTPNKQNNFGMTPLHLTARKGYRDVAEILLNNGADIKKQDNQGMTPLHYSALKGHLEVADILLLMGADIDKQNNDGITPLHLAAQNGHLKLAEILRKFSRLGGLTCRRSHG